jgi:hypothetical protein
MRKISSRTENGADLEPDDAVDLFALRRAHDDRRLARAIGLAQPAADLGACEIRQHQIEHDHVGGRIARRGREALPSAVREPDGKPLGAQVVLERGREVDFVFDDQDQSAHDAGVARVL